jgi:hypothetical protein
VTATREEPVIPVKDARIIGRSLRTAKDDSILALGNPVVVMLARCRRVMQNVWKKADDHA